MDLPRRADEVKLDPNRRLYWLRQKHDQMRRYDKEPGSIWSRRLMVRWLTVLPIN